MHLDFQSHMYAIVLIIVRGESAKADAFIEP